MLACRRQPAFCTIVAALFLVIGCQRSREGEPQIDAAGQQDNPAAATVTPDPQPDDDAAAALQKVIDDVETGEADAVLMALPPSYREDLDRVLALGLRPLDPQARRAMAEAVVDLAQTLIEKESLVLASDRIELAGPAAPFVRDNFAALCRVVAAVARWPGWSSVENPDAASLIAATVRAVSIEPSLIDALQKVRFRNVEGSDENRRVLVHTGDEKGGVEFAVERIEGRWLPERVARRWSATLDDLDTDRLSSHIAQREAELRELTSRIRDISQSLAAVETQDEFNTLADRAATLLLATAAQAKSAPRSLKADEFATVVVLGELSEEQKDRLVWDLASHSDDPSNGIADAVDPRDQGDLVISVGPVSDIEAFAKRLPGVQVERVDAKAKKITARLAAP
ncbi:MAG: hypothetical protein M3552_04435 [Planctomycetota bacterium]|nr:hypothetical protein [Planctomycetaceae bacterium]MDQ3329888.1 hypothetical protein [Planctomycetota bacterium]